MFFEIKADLKARAKALRTKKEEVKVAQRAGTQSGQSDLIAQQWDYRHRHVAYCLVRGRTMEQIEKNPRRPLNDKLLKSYTEGYRLHVAIKKGELKKGPPDHKRLYVVVDDTLPQKYASVQAAHAVAEYMKIKKDFPNGTLVVLRASPAHVAQLGFHPSWVRFHEPDLEGRLTAVSGFQEKNYLVEGLALL
jgi:hypothetical protein